jgi:chemotaxis response regulator CheB
MGIGASQQPEAPADPPEVLEEERAGACPFPIVGVGASAGGLEAFTQLLGPFPGDTGVALVLIQHLDPTHESKLAGLLAKATPMPVLEATQDLAVHPDHIYVIPRNTTLTIAGGVLQLAPRGEARGPHLPIDLFLKSLAEDQRSAAIGVVLSGTGSDGTLGLAEIKAAGGITFAQDKESAKHDGMPRSAAASGSVDFILPPHEIARELARIGRHPYLAPPRLSDAARRTSERSRSGRSSRCCGPPSASISPATGTRASSGGPCGAWPFTPGRRWRTTPASSRRTGPNSRPSTRTSSSM